MNASRKQYAASVKRNWMADKTKLCLPESEPLMICISTFFLHQVFINGRNAVLEKGTRYMEPNGYKRNWHMPYILKEILIQVRPPNE